MGITSTAMGIERHINSDRSSPSSPDYPLTQRSGPLSERETAELFQKGNYCAVAAYGYPDSWHKYAALALIALPDEAVAGLRRWNTPEARFYSGVAYWIAGLDHEAVVLLQGCELPQAKRLLKLIQKPKIKVLAQQSRKFREVDSKFDVVSFGYEEGDLSATPYASIEAYYDPKDPPDFYACFVVEQREIPRDIQRFPGPTFGVTSDYDIHIQTIVPWLKALDQVVVAGPQEWQDVSTLTSGRVACFPKLYGYNSFASAIVSPNERTTDVFISGTIAHPYNPDKFEAVNAVFSMPEIKLYAIDGFVGSAEYLKQLGRSKVTFCYVRRPDEMPTRGLESLAMGVATVVQKESVLNYYFGEEQGLFVYNNANDLPGVIRRILSNWEAVSQKVMNGCELARVEFSAGRTYSQYLRFLTVLASQEMPARQVVSPDDLYCKEIFCFRGYHIENEVREERRAANMKMWTDLYLRKPSASILIDMAREAGIEAVIQNYHPASASRSELCYSVDTLPSVWALYDAALSTFPLSLVVRFNFARCLLHFGDEAEVLYGLRLITETLAFNDSELNLELMQDVYPWDFFSQLFNYRSYFDAIFNALLRPAVPPPINEMKRLIRASLHCYLGHYADSDTNFKMACELDPAHSYYKFARAISLMQSGSMAQMVAAGPLLEELLSSSMYFRDVWKPLERLVKAGIYSSPLAAQHLERARRLNGSIHKSFYVENFYPAPLKPKPIGLDLLPLDKRFLDS